VKWQFTKKGRKRGDGDADRLAKKQYKRSRPLASNTGNAAVVEDVKELA